MNDKKLAEALRNMIEVMDGQLGDDVVDDLCPSARKALQSYAADAAQPRVQKVNLTPDNLRSVASRLSSDTQAERDARELLRACADAASAAQGAEPVADVKQYVNGGYALFWRSGKTIMDFNGCALYTHPQLAQDAKDAAREGGR